MMKTLTVEIRSFGANDEILLSLLEKKRDSMGTIHWQMGDKAFIADGVSITYSYQKRFEAEGIAEPINFTINFVDGIAGNIIAAYIYDRIKHFGEKIAEVKVNGEVTTLSRGQIEKAFLREIDELD